MTKVVINIPLKCDAATSWVGISYCLAMGNAMFGRLYQTLCFIWVM